MTVRMPTGRRIALAAWTAFGLSPTAHADQVTIEHASFEAQADNRWRVSVRLRHADSGWEHYADAWRVVSADGRVLGTRTLYHPHVDEQPFTRSLGGVAIPPGDMRVYVEAHDKVHGWAPKRLAVDLDESEGPGFDIRR